MFRRMRDEANPQSGATGARGAAVRIALLGALGMPALAGCGNEDSLGRGTLVIPYVLGNERTCESLGVVDVKVVLDNGYREEVVECDDRPIRIRDLEAGRYDIELYGLDDEGFPVLDSEEMGPHRERVPGAGSVTEVNPAIVLTAAPAELLVRWEFGFGSCTSTGIDHFEITAWDADDGIDKLLVVELPCDTAGEGADQYRQVPDEDRALGGDVFGGVSVVVIDENGAEVGKRVSYEFPAPGAGRQVKLSLTCDNSGCEGSGKPD